MANDIVGRQISFPLGLSDRNQLAAVGGDAAIRQAIYLIINTVPGERVMRPGFGCKIHELVFAPANEDTAILAQRYVREALETWEPRIKLVDVSVQPESSLTGVGKLMITISYRIKGQMDERELVQPYFLNPESDQMGGNA